MTDSIIFRDLIEAARKGFDNEEVSYQEIIEATVAAAYEAMAAHEVERVAEIDGDTDSFIARNCERWKTGFRKLRTMQQISIEAGMAFQKQFLQHEEYVHDPLLGVLMRQHANACRITDEIIHLLKGGFPDGALARWRTLFEIAVTCMVLHKHGNEAAIDYIKHGKIKAIEGMEEYQKTAKEMRLEPYSETEFQEALKVKEELSSGEPYFQWAKKYVGAGKMEKLREYVGLGKWSHNYKLASRNIHADFSEMLSMLAMSEAKEDLLLVGPSNSGLMDPAHMTAITLSQITSTFLTAHIEESELLDYTDNCVFLFLIQKYVDAVGEEFLACSRKTK